MSSENNNDLFAAAPKPFLSSDKPGKPTGSRKRLMEEKVQGKRKGGSFKGTVARV
jgi:hypothetical protein